MNDYGYPDFDQGWGRVDLSVVLPHPDAPAARRLELVDISNESADALESRAAPDALHRALHSYVVTVAADAVDPLRAALCWTDPPATSIQNDLGLQVIGPDSKRYAGNAEYRYGRNAQIEHPDVNGILWDEQNTIEQVVVDKPPPGQYEVRVVARNTIEPPQGFALVVAGELTGPIVKHG